MSEAKRSDAERAAQAQRTRRWREGKGKGYAAKYNTAITNARKRLIDNHPKEWEKILAEERRKVGLD